MHYNITIKLPKNAIKTLNGNRLRFCKAHFQKQVASYCTYEWIHSSERTIQFQKFTITAAGAERAPPRRMAVSTQERLSLRDINS